jgi:hypothetical protein
MTKTEHKRMLRLEAQVHVLRKFRIMANARKKTIQRLTKELSAEKRLNNALSRLAFAPADKQKAGVMKELRRCTTIRRKVAEERRAA